MALGAILFGIVSLFYMDMRIAVFSYMIILFSKTNLLIDTGKDDRYAEKANSMEGSMWIVNRYLRQNKLVRMKIGNTSLCNLSRE